MPVVANATGTPPCCLLASLATGGLPDSKNWTILAGCALLRVEVHHLFAAEHDRAVIRVRTRRVHRADAPVLPAPRHDVARRCRRSRDRLASRPEDRVQHLDRMNHIPGEFERKL